MEWEYKNLTEDRVDSLQYSLDELRSTLMDVKDTERYNEARLFDHFETHNLEIASNLDQILCLKQELEQAKEEIRLREAQKRNARLRNLIQHVKWDGTACIVYWNDGTQTKAIWNDEERFDPEKALLVCIGRKFYQENPNVLNNMLDKWSPAGWNHYFDNLTKDKWTEDNKWWELV